MLNICLSGREVGFIYLRFGGQNAAFLGDVFIPLEQISVLADRLFEKLGDALRLDLKLHERQFQRRHYEYLEIELSIS